MTDSLGTQLTDLKIFENINENYLREEWDINANFIPNNPVSFDMRIALWYDDIYGLGNWAD